MMTLMFENLSLFPAWLQMMLLVTWGGILILMPVYSIIKIMQSRTMADFFRAAPQALTKVGAFLQYQIDDPIKFPQTLRALEYISVIIYYLLALLLFLNFIVFVFLWGFEQKKLSIFQQIGTVGFSFLCAYWAAALKTQGSRTLIKLREK